ncbi:DUF6850 family outer membrane beta-barrel protein [uncultured Rikenella sp.]|uniref:DUF6850 family outer membrane beta-barrel protein n=1 Tax=uncultured Rikenella sp. TaxID=368003 RepID=UPI002612B70D|nr:DUF6850 family outer membrane beta-barrel protein [uncultured Rikenella sp.]
MSYFRSYFLCALYLPIITDTAAQPVDSLPLFRRIMLDASPAQALPAAILRNPAAMRFRQDYPLSELSVSYEDTRRGDAALSQQGNGYGGFGFAARSFVPTGARGSAFGEAGYSNGTRRNVQWSETADIEWLYPYLTADSAGGSLTSETYRFSGGYAHTVGQWTWAAQLAYRAMLEYREIDPRPRNVVSDLQGSLAAARSAGADYQIALAVRGRKYGQRGDIDFYNEMNQATIYHLTGLGMDYVRFAGVQTDAYYSGWGAGGSIDFFPASRNGFSVSAAYDYFTFRKEMTGMNNLPLVSADDHAANVQLSYTASETELAWGATAGACYRHRTGTEHIFGDPAGNIYPQIGSNEAYTSRIANGTLSGFVGSLPAARTVWWVEPSVSYLDFQSEYAPARREMSFSRWQAGVDGTVMRTWRRWMLRAEAGASRSGKIKGILSLPGADFSTSRIRSLRDDYRYLTDSFTRVRIELQVDCRVGNERALFVRGGWTRDWFRESGTADGWTVGVGFGF